MSGGLNPIRTIELAMIRGTSNSLNVRGRLLEVTDIFRTQNEGLLYCRGVIQDNTGSMPVAFWNVSEVIHLQVLALQDRCVVMTAVQAAIARDGYQDRSKFSLNYNAGATQSSKAKRTSPTSTIAEIAENALFPAVLVPMVAAEHTPLTTPLLSTTSSAPGSPAGNNTSSQGSPGKLSTTVTPRKRSPERPEDLVRYTCVKCDVGHMPSCGATGAPHPATCSTCGFLEAPVVCFCPVTGFAHGGITLW